jgi:integrase
MAIRKRGAVWWIDFTTPTGERIRRSAETGDKTEAQEYHDRLKAEAWRQDKLDEGPKRSWNDAVVRWCAEQAHKATAEEDKAKLRWLDRYLGNRLLESINRDMIEHVTRAKQADGCSNATVNRTLALVRSILRKCAREWQWVDRAPAVRMLKEPTRRVRYLTHEEADRLLAELPAHLHDMAAFSLESGLRAANVTGLRWSAVDLNRKLAWVHPDEAKARKAIPVPLNGEAMSILQKQIGKHRDYVFTFKGQHVEQLSTAAWYKALKRAGIENFRWHDLRHTWASWHVQSGTPLHVLQELGGWASYAMVQRYAHLAADHLAPWAERLARPRRSRGTNPSQPTDRANDKVMPASRKSLSPERNFGGP